MTFENFAWREICVLAGIIYESELEMSVEILCHITDSQPSIFILFILFLMFFLFLWKIKNGQIVIVNITLNMYYKIPTAGVNF